MTRDNNSIIIPEKPQALSGIHSRSFMAVAAVAALLVAPQAALAQAECGPQLDPGNPETVTCDPQDYPGGITYDSLGDLTLQVPDDEVDLRLLDAGASVTGNGADNIFWDSSAFVSGEIVGDADLGTFDSAVLDYRSDTGDVDILVGGGVKGLDDASHAIRAESTGGGDVTVTTQGLVNDAFGGPRPSGIGIEALTTTGNIAIDAAKRVDSGREGGQYAVHAASSTGGNITIDLIGDGNFAALAWEGTHGILAETTGTGSITINATDEVQATSSGVAGIEAIAESGDIRITGDGVSGKNGVIAQTGTGAIVLDLGSVQGRVGSHAIQAMSDSGDITIDVGNVQQSLGGTAIVTHTDGLATLNLLDTIRGSGVTLNVGSFTGGADTGVRSTGAGDVAVNVPGDPDFDLYRGLDQPNAHLQLGKGNGLVELGSVIAAPFDFAGLGGSTTVVFERGSGWFLPDPEAVSASQPYTGPRNRLSGGDDIITILPGAVMSTPVIDVGNFNSIYGYQLGALGVRDALREGSAGLLRYAVEFGAGTDVLEMAGDLFVGAMENSKSEIEEDETSHFEMRLEGLDEFRFSGAIWLGGRFGNLGQQNTSDFSGLTDGYTDDILGLPGTHFIGELDGDGNALGRIRADVRLGELGQTGGCGLEHRDDGNDMAVADCIDLRDGHATGKTLFILNQAIPGDRGAYNPAGSVLVDVGGDNAGQTDPLAFGIAPESFQYGELPDGTGVIDKGLFFYAVAYDPANEQYRLYGLPGSASQQFPLLRQAASSLWRTSTNAWFDRQVDQRDVEADAGLGSGVWGRATVGSVERDIDTPIEGGGVTFDFDNSYTQDEDTITIGWDLISRDGAGGAWLIGGMLGHTRSSLYFDDSPNAAKLRGMHAGVYTSIAQGGFYLDGVINLTRLDVDNDVPALNLSPDTAQLETEAESAGARLEAGYRLMLGPVGIEPLAGLSWVKTKLDDIDVPADDPNRFGGLIQFKYSTSNSASAGLRLSMEDLLPNIAPTGISLTARTIERINDRAEVTIENLGPIPAVTSDDLESSFTQITGSVNVTNPGETLAGYVNFDVLTGDDYDSNNVSLGVRYQW